MRTLGWWVALGLELSACTQVAGLDADYTSSENGGTGASSASSSGVVPDASASSSSGAATGSSGASNEPADSGVTSSASSSGASGQNPCALALETGSVTDCARCVLGEAGCGEVCEALDATGYLLCLRAATDKGDAEECVRIHLRRNEPRATRQTACIDRCAQGDRPCN